MLIVQLALVLLALAAAAFLALLLHAVVREPRPLCGDALAATPEARAYADGQARLLTAHGIDARRRQLELRDPEMRVHALEIAGDGPPLLLLHGGGSSAMQWLPLLPELRGRHLILVDRPGCGLSDGFDYRGVDLRRHGAAFIGSVLDALGLRQAVLVGNSMGGLWALSFALEEPERVAAIVVIGTPAVTLGTGVPKPLRMLATPGVGQLMMRGSPSVETARARLAGVLGARAVAQFPSDLLALSLLGEQIPGAKRSFRTLARAAMSPGVAPSAAELATITAPVLWVWGDADLFADPGFPARAQAALPASKLVVLPGAGHCPWADDAAASARAIRDFLTTAAPARAM